MKLFQKYWWLVCCGVLAVCAVLFVKYHDRIPFGTDAMLRLRGKHTISDRQAQYGPAARAHWKPYFQRENLAYPPRKLTLVAFKKERQLEIYAADAHGAQRYLRTFYVQALSGKPGPKLRFGDGQVPEGFYKVESLNPNSAFHLALRLNYPNEEDRKLAAQEGRTNLGSDIMIHGSNKSIGCLAMGDPAIEDIFVLAADTGIENIEVLICPVDFRKGKNVEGVKISPGLSNIYDRLQIAVKEMPPTYD